jgi:dolichol-phosphate mannosyltransferase
VTSAEGGRAPAALSVVVPTYNERANVRPLVARIATALAAIPFEVIFVDDGSPDGTADEIRSLAREDPRCRLILRHERRGLAGAAVEGMLSAVAPVVALMDGDLQHDEAALPRMFALIDGGIADMVVATRYGVGGSGEALGDRRMALSALGNWLAHRLFRHRLSDPMSGYFAARRAVIEGVAPRVSAEGFKVLVDIASALPPGTRIAEVPYQFRARGGGASKLDIKVALEFAALLVSKLSGGRLPLRFVLFSFVGAFGIVVHLATAWLVLTLGQPFFVAQTVATFTAMTGNFFLNNEVTHRDRRLKAGGMVRGLVQFYVVCSVGVIGNVGVASLMFREHPVWWLASLAGALIGTVWNYAVSAVVVWRRR